MTTKPPIDDRELILYHYRDGLPQARLREIDAALATDVALSARYARLCATLDASALDLPPEPAQGLSDRIWQGVSARAAVGTAVPPPARSSHRHGFGRRRLQRGLAAGIAAAVLLSASFMAGREHGLQEQAPTPIVASERVYANVLAQHLDSTRHALMTAVNAEGDSLRTGNADLARALIDNNRLYLAAARHSGDTRLVDLLQTLEPVLIELANPARADDIQLRTGLGEFVERSDLIFQVRAAEAGLRARNAITST
jgi:hypothetical protein